MLHDDPAVHGGGGVLADEGLVDRRVDVAAGGGEVGEVEDGDVVVVGVAIVRPVAGALVSLG